jgi:hypothetical protein
MRVVPGLIKDGEVQVFIEVQEEPDNLEIAGLDLGETDSDEETERAAESDDEREEGDAKEDGEEEDEDEDGDEDDDEEDDEDDSVSRLEVVADAVAAVCETLYQRLQAKLDEDEAPTEFRIEFGITLAGSMGIPVVSQGDTAAAFKVTVKWENG